MTFKWAAVAACMLAGVSASRADEPPAGKSPVTGKIPLDVINAAPKGSIHNPYTGQADKIAAGQQLFQSYSCSGCHGGGGGGGICPPLTKVVWIYGGDDDSVARLITLGTDELQKRGYARQAILNVVGPMPAFGTLIKSDDELYKIMAFVRSVYKGKPNKIVW
jgi:mono/diheme cytochrome c family protein